MKVQRFEWAGASATAAAVRSWSAEAAPPVEVDSKYSSAMRGYLVAIRIIPRRRWLSPMRSSPRLPASTMRHLPKPRSSSS